MTFKYNGTNIPVNGHDASAASVREGGALEKFSQKPLRILLVAAVALVLLYSWNRYALYRVLFVTGLVVVQSILGEGFHAARDRRCAMPEQRSPLMAWLVRFVKVELLSIILTIAEMFLMVTLGIFGM